MDVLTFIAYMVIFTAITAYATYKSLAGSTKQDNEED